MVLSDAPVHIARTLTLSKLYENLKLEISPNLLGTKYNSISINILILFVLYWWFMIFIEM